MRLQKMLVVVAVLWTMAVIVLGAYTRLTDAGLGCPDWPGCYGFLQVPQHETHIELAEARFPDRPLEAGKAWNEMVHRYFAGTLGLLILVLFINGWRHQQRRVPALLLALVVFQAALGMWTVTLALHPVVVMAHLLGGFSLLSLLALHWWQLQPRPVWQVSQTLKKLFWPVLLVLTGQIALGGWTSANYAALSCIQLPLCEPGWMDRLNFDEAFSLHLGYDSYEFGVMSLDARATVHLMHRVWALVTAVVVLGYAWLLWRQGVAVLRTFALLIGLLLLLQISLGVANVVLHLPLINAVAHNFVAANLLMCLVCSGYLLHSTKESLYAENSIIAASGQQSVA
ncbi:COX15/CtaA family protein [Rheinheimera sp.]|uniref:COX15/CtaA family protein n=1 Tax=Rheinheimera sp. TaxID=1869214 RepID=UPI00307E5943